LKLSKEEKDKMIDRKSRSIFSDRAYFREIFENNADNLDPYPQTWNELRGWIDKIDISIPTPDLMTMLKQIPKEDYCNRCNVYYFKFKKEGKK
jgi:hypothetical protein